MTHHQNHGHVENDESWHPLPERIFRSLDDLLKKFRFTAPFAMFAYPFYLWGRSAGKKGSHFHPSSDLFFPNEKKDVITSTVCWTAMAALLVGLSFIFVIWLGFITYLHPDGHEDKLPWYCGKKCEYFACYS